MISIKKMKLYWCKVNTLDTNFIRKSFPLNVIGWPCEPFEYNKNWRLLIVAYSDDDVRTIIARLWKFVKIESIEQKSNNWLPSSIMYPLGLERTKLSNFRFLLNESCKD